MKIVLWFVIHVFWLSDAHCYTQYTKQYGFDFPFSFTWPEYPIAMILVYAYLIKVLPSYSSPIMHPKTLLFQQIIVSLHNVCLAIFSMLCCFKTWPIFFTLLGNGWSDALCEDTFWDNDTWWYWVWLFYLSKYYEFIDTFILIWKNKKVSFLQAFHHIGAVMSMWIVVATKSHTAYCFVIPNSFIHSFMYTYYALSAWKCKIKIRFKHMLTRMQISQFCISLAFGFIEVYHWQCIKIHDKISIIFNAIYVPILLLLFTQFYANTYRQKRKP
eukprot:201086_1